MNKKYETFSYLVYNTHFPKKDNPILFHGPFYNLRKTFFESNKSVKLGGIAYISGIENTYFAKITAKSCQWELKYGNSYLQRLYKESGGYSVVTFDYLNKVVSKSIFDKKHKWVKTVYYESGNISRPEYCFEYEDGAIIMLKYNSSELSYLKYPLYSFHTITGTKENSILDGKFGQPLFYIATENGDYGFYTEAALAQGRKEMNADLEQKKSEIIWDNTEIDSSSWSIPEEMALSENYRYIGELNESGERHGRGRTEQQNGFTAYEGEYFQGERSGKGACYYDDGILSYYGSWSESKKNGVGVSIKKGFEGFHIGNWSAGKLLGSSATFDEKGNLKNIGYITNEATNSIKVELIQNKYFIGSELGNGNLCGSVFSLNGSLLYCGEYKDGKYCGKGTLYAPDGGIIMHGTFKDNICIQKIKYEEN